MTTDMHVRYYRQPRGGPLRAEAEMVLNGRTLLSAECSVLDAANRVLIRSTAPTPASPVKAASYPAARSNPLPRLARRRAPPPHRHRPNPRRHPRPSGDPFKRAAIISSSNAFAFAFATNLGASSQRLSHRCESAILRLINYQAARPEVHDPLRLLPLGARAVSSKGQNLSSS